jgi:hypothetical protein
MFPELADVPIHQFKTTDSLKDSVLSQRGTLLRAAGLQITPGLRVRIRNAAHSQIDSGRIKEITAICQKRNVIWINIRSHNKMWKSQVEGYSSVLNTLHEEFGNIGVAYDGFSDAAEICSAIDEELQPSIERYHLIGCDIAESIVWAENVSAYVSVVGSGLVINSWLVSKGGIAHGNVQHLNQQKFWNNVAPEAVPVCFLDKSAVACDLSLYGNYDFDWRLLVPRLREILSNNNISR